MIETPITEIPERSFMIIGVEHYNPEFCPVALRRVAFRVNDKWVWFGEHMDRGAASSLSDLLRSPDDRVFVFAMMMQAVRWQKAVG